MSAALRLASPEGVEPVPLSSFAFEERVGSEVIAGEASLWAPGETRRCRRCEVCSADHDRGFCLVVTIRRVAST